MQNFIVKDLESDEEVEVSIEGSAIEAAAVGNAKMNGDGWLIRYVDPKQYDVPNIEVSLMFDSRRLFGGTFFVYPNPNAIEVQENREPTVTAAPSVKTRGKKAD